MCIEKKTIREGRDSIEHRSCGHLPHIWNPVTVRPVTCSKGVRSYVIIIQVSYAGTPVLYFYVTLWPFVNFERLFECKPDFLMKSNLGICVCSRCG